MLKFYRKSYDKHRTFWQISTPVSSYSKTAFPGDPWNSSFYKTSFYNLGVILMPKQTVSHLQCCSQTILCTVVRYSSTPLILIGRLEIGHPGWQLFSKRKSDSNTPDSANAFAEIWCKKCFVTRTFSLTITRFSTDQFARGIKRKRPH